MKQSILFCSFIVLVCVLTNDAAFSRSGTSFGGSRSSSSSRSSTGSSSGSRSRGSSLGSTGSRSGIGSSSGSRSPGSSLGSTGSRSDIGSSSGSRSPGSTGSRSGGSKGRSSIGSSSGSRSRSTLHGHPTSFESSRMARGSSPYLDSTWRSAAYGGLIFGGLWYLRRHPTRTTVPTICTNKDDTSLKGSIYFVCPRENLPSDYTYCCGDEDDEYCCTKLSAERYYQSHVFRSRSELEETPASTKGDTDDDKVYGVDPDDNGRRRKHQGDSGNMTSPFGWVGFVCLFGLTNVLMTFH